MRHSFTFRLPHLRMTRRRKPTANMPAVIEISSSEDDDQRAAARPSLAKCAYSQSNGPWT